jgi:hypothetical protein
MDLLNNTKFHDSVLEFTKFKHASPTKKGETEAKKAKVRKFPHISDALASAGYGSIFTTPQSDRIYVITRGTWGKKSKSKVVKGFPLSTPYDEIVAYSKRTRSKHGSGVDESPEEEN